MDHGVMLAREQRVDADAGARGDLLEAVAFDLMRDENVALVLGQFVEGVFELVEQNGSRIDGSGPGIRRGQQVFQAESFTLAGDSYLIVSERPQALLAKRSIMRLRATRNIQALHCCTGSMRR